MAHKPAGASSFSFKVSTAYKQASTSSFFLKDPPYNHDRSKLAVTNECDSGVTDDQRSSCGEEEGGGDDPYGLGSSRSHPKAPGSSEDADSAQGSLLLESSDSPSALDCVPLAEEPQQDEAPCPAATLARPEEKDATPTSRSSVSVQCNGPDSLQKVLQAQSSMSLPEERRVNPPPAKTSSSKLAHLIQSFESVSVAPEVPVRRRYNASPRNFDPTPTENGRPTSPKQSRITPSLPPLSSLPKATTIRTTSSPPSGGGVASSRNVTLPVNVPLQRTNATMLSTSLPVTFVTGATTSVTRVSFATNDAGTNLVTPKTNSVPDVNGVSNGGSNVVLAGRDALCSAEAVEEERMPRSSTLFWDPTELLKELYSVEPPQLHGRDLGGVEYVNKEGYLDMMPSNRKKATYWNPWKRRYFRLCDGNLSCFETMYGVAKALDILQGEQYMYMGVLQPTLHSLLRYQGSLSQMQYCTPLSNALEAGVKKRPSRDPNPLEGSTRGSSAHRPADERAATGSRPLPRHGEAVAATAAGNKSLSCTQQKCLLPREPPRSRHRIRLDHKYLHPAGNAAPESRRASPPPPARYGAGSTLVAVRGRFEWFWPSEIAEWKGPRVKRAGINHQGVLPRFLT
ncbi:uncharacterized protein ISCGN_009425 [Ixodes scapularis]